jgi:hypothetical protein
MTTSSLIKRLALAGGIPAAAAAGVLFAAGTSAASSHPIPVRTATVTTQTTRPAPVTHERRDAVEPTRHHNAEPGDDRGQANLPGEDVRGQDDGAEQADDRSGTQGDVSSGPGHDSSGDD